MFHRVFQSLRMTSPSLFKIKLLVYLLLLSSIPVGLMGFISAYTSSNIIRGQAVQSNALMLLQTEKELNSYLKKIDDLMLQYTFANSNSTSILKRFVDTDLSRENWQAVGDLGDILVKLQSGMEHVLELDFYSVPYGKLLSSHGKLYTDLQFGDPLAISEAQRQTYSNRWIDLRMSVPGHDGLDKPVLTIVKPVVQNNRVEAALIVYLDATAISSYKLTPPDTYKGSALFITDSQGNVILHSQTAKIGGKINDSAFQNLLHTDNTDGIEQRMLTLDGVDYTTAVLRSETRNWFYVAAVPEKAFTAKPRAQRNIMLSISIALVLIALVISYRASNTIYRPLQRLTSKLKPSAGSADAVRDEVELLDSYLDSLSLQNERLSKQITLYSEHAKHFLLHQLLVGNMPNQNIPLADQETLPHDRLFIPLLIIDLNRLQMLEYYSRRDCILFYYAVENIASELLGRHGHPQVIMIQPGMFVAIVPMRAPVSPGELRVLGSELLDAIRGYLKLNTCIAVSYSDTGSAGLHGAFEEAVHLLRYRFIVGDNKVVLIDDLETDVSLQADMLFDCETEILNAVRSYKSGEAEAVFLSLTEMLQESFSISADFLRSYFTQLLGSIVKAVSAMPQSPFDSGTLQRLLPGLAERRTLDEVRTFFRVNVFAVLHEEYDLKNVASPQASIVQQVLEYIHTRYDTDLSLQQCADLVGLHTFDLSRMFKRVKGVNFIDYLIELRMEKAKEMLADPQLRLQDIADKLRYTSLQGFMRAFKKSTSMTPGQYRSQL